MIANVRLSSFTRPPLSPAAVVLCCLAILIVAFRIFESPANPATAFRVLMSVLALGFVLFARQRSMMQRAGMFVCLEALGGVVAFAYIDAPFVVSHQPQINALVLSLYHGIAAAH
jgi:hypothetical protein